MGWNPSAFVGTNYPVEQVTWDESQDFIAALNTRGAGYFRLPTEAEWEYACRAGGTATYFFGDDPLLLGSYSWYLGNADARTHPVASTLPNEWGLYGMLGNVWEWVHDWEGAYPSGASTDPIGPLAGSFRATRGGGWLTDAERCQSAIRGGYDPDRGYAALGLRLYRAED
jgi:formylglycine-generating enzyme required for sulfatase activity